MFASTHRRVLRPVMAMVTLGILSACGGSSIDGEYYNAQSGEFALELKDGKVLRAQGMEGMNLSYTVRGDSLILDDASTSEPADLVVAITKDGALDFGPLGSLKRK